MRSTFLLGILLIAVIATGAIGGFLLLREVGQRRPLEFLPADTLAMVQAEDLDRLRRAVSRTPMGEASSASGSDLVAEVVSILAGARGIPPGTTGLIPDGDLPIEAVLAVIPGPERPAPPGRSDMALLLRIGHGSDRVIDQIGRIIRERVAVPGGAWRTHEHRGIEYESYLLPGSQRAIWVAAHRGVVILGDSGRGVRRLIDTSEGASAPLGGDPLFRGIMSRLDRRSDLLVYLSGHWLRDHLFGGRQEPGSARVRKLMGAGAIRAVGLVARVRKGRFEESGFVSLAPDQRGLPGELFDSAPSTSWDDPRVPDGFPFYAVIAGTGLDAVYPKLPAIIAQATGTDPNEISDRIGGFEKFLAVDLRDDVLAAIGSRMAVGFGSPSRYPRGAANRRILNTPAVAAIGIRRAAAIGSILERLDGLARATASYRRSGDDGAPLTHYHVASLAPLEPSYRLAGDALLVATSPDLLAGTGRQPFTRRADIADSMRRLPAKAHVFFCADTARLIDLLTDGSQAPRAGLLREMILSRLQETGEAGPLPVSAVAAIMARDGVAMHGVSPVSPTLLAILFVSDGLREGVGSPEAYSPVPPPVGEAAASLELR